MSNVRRRRNLQTHMSESDQKQIIQRIVDVAVSVAEPGWLELVADYHADDQQSNLLSSYLMQEGNKKVEKWLPVPDSFDGLLRELRSHLARNGKEPFSSCKLHLWANGRFDMAYGYDEVPWKQLTLRRGNFV
jgi:Protein of unknown function, DUF600